MLECPVCMRDPESDSRSSWYANYGCGHMLHWECFLEFIRGPGSKVAISQVGDKTYPKPIMVHNCLQLDAPYTSGLILPPILAVELERVLAEDNAVGATNNPGTRIRHFNEFIKTHNELTAYHGDAGIEPITPLQIELHHAILTWPKERSMNLPVPIEPSYPSRVYRSFERGIALPGAFQRWFHSIRDHTLGIPLSVMLLVTPLALAAGALIGTDSLTTAFVLFLVSAVGITGCIFLLGRRMINRERRMLLEGMPRL